MSIHTSSRPFHRLVGATARRLAVALVFVGPCASALVAADSAPSLDFAGSVSMTGAVIEGAVTAIGHSFSESNGPRTQITLSDVRARVGRAPRRIVLDVYGGPRPDGTFEAVADEPQFIVGKRYLVFLTNRQWRISPVVRRLAFRIEDVDGKEVLVDNDGRPARTVGRSGIVFGRSALFDPVGPFDKVAPVRVAAASAAVARVAEIPSVNEFVAGLRSSFPDVDRADRKSIRLTPDLSGGRAFVAAKASTARVDTPPDSTIPERLRRHN